METRVWMLLTAVAVLLLAIVVVLFSFGTPQAPETAQLAAGALALPEPGAAAPGSAGGVAGDAVGQSTASDSGDMSGVGVVDPAAQPPEADPSSPLAIEIPGCVCHSDDPNEVERHATYRMNQCYGCHAGAPGAR